MNKFHSSAARQGCFGVFTVLLLVAVSGCSSTLVPTAARDTAASLDTGETQLDIGFPDSPSISISYGLNEHTDIGFDAQQVSTIWVKRTLNQSNPGLSTALTAGLFAGDLDNGIVSDRPDLDVEGGYLGGILEFATTDRLNLSLAYRYNYTHYDSFTLDRNGLYLFETRLYFDQYYDPWTVSSDDLRGVSLVTLQGSVLLRSHLRLHLGINCQFNHTEDNARLPPTECNPLLGLSFNQR